MDITNAVFLDFASIHPDDLDVSELNASAEDWRYIANTKPADVLSTIGNADVVVVNKVQLDRQVISSAKKLKLICAAATGVNNIDLLAARDHGVTVCNVRRYATPAVVQHVFALILSLTTRLSQYRADVENKNWSRSEFFCLLDYPIRELQGLTLGIVGYGELGQAVANVAEAFGMRVLLAKSGRDDDRAGRIDLHDLLPQLDVLSLHCPLTDDTLNLIGEKELALMKPDALLINTARGGLVDEKALLKALKESRLAGAGLDVLVQEPPPEDYFLLQQKLPNLIITPHTAWASRQARQRLVDEIAENINAFGRGRARNIVS